MNRTTNTPVRPLERPRDDRVIAGVASGLSRRLGIGTGWIRVAFVFLSFFGGLGILLYIVGWLAIREEGERTAIAENWIGDLEGSTAWVGVGLIILAGIVLLGATELVRVELVLAAGLFLAGVLLYRGGIGPGAEATPDREEGVAAAALAEVDEAVSQVEPDLASPPPPPPAPPMAPATVADGRVFAPAPPPAPPAEPRRPSYYLGRIVVASALIVIGIMALLDNVGATDPGARHYVAAVVLVLGLGLIVGSFVGRARGLIALGLLLVPVLLVTAAVRVPFGGEWGDRYFAPASAAELLTDYELSGGQLTVDLRGLTEQPVDTPVRADLGIGEMIVWLPAGVDVQVSADVGIGALDILGDESGGLGVDDTFLVSGGDGEIDLVLDLQVGIGALRVSAP